ncbi:putative PBS lyase HEAT-like repeat [Nitrosotalea sinensis]|jgi:deoxyhypusine monooxygenase|uniref:Putative PBS lyase HEAT-like repeat n=1 Tax=Nitrosotalea sinensis TaxID=1499975 RepID=A0A2H1EI14_9ARCH|nr:HEAT repeat domain-containing protein [Candidatus Nitrosotalea sinensis]SHO46233.1 putative PBS lyase HEAT-like repeat [Candidatus Nitrosotalea sinensis]
MEVIPSGRLELLSEMEEKYEKKDKQYFVKLLDDKDFVIRCRAVCILVDMGGEDVVPHVANVLKNDSNELVRHEAAFSLGQMCLRSGIKPLEDATRNDPSLFVRHEAAVALGVIGSQDAKETLQKALEDSSEQVRDSAVVALSNLKFMESMCKNDRFAKLTGG